MANTATITRPVNVITAENVAAAAADLVTAEATTSVRFAVFATSAFLTTDSVRKVSAAVKKVGAVKYASVATINRVQVVGRYLARDLSTEAVDGAFDLYSAVIACANTKGVGLVPAQDAVDAANSIGEAIAAVQALVEGKAEAPATDGADGEGEGDEAEVVAEVPADKSDTYLQQAVDALNNFTSKGTPTREHEGVLEIILAQVNEALALVRTLPLPHGVIVAA